jgi:hypothetical protein
VNRAYFSNEVLMPAFLVAYDDLRERLVDNNIALMNQTSEEYTINVGMKDIGGATGPPLPNDFMVPYAIWEKLAGSENDYDLLDHRIRLPKTNILTEALCYWEYSKQIIHFLGANTDRNVKIDYIANNLLLAEDPEAMVSAFNCQSYLAYRTAALSAKYLGENDSRSNELNMEAINSLDNIINMDVKSRQNIPARRIPFNRSYRSSGIWSF